jgi:ribosomal protein S10
MRKKNYTIKLISLNYKVLHCYRAFLINYLQKLSGVTISSIYLPVKQKKLSLLKSPHVNKKAFEHFQFTKYTLIIKISFTFFLRNLLNQALVNKPQTIKMALLKNF